MLSLDQLVGNQITVKQERFPIDSNYTEKTGHGLGKVTWILILFLITNKVSLYFPFLSLYRNLLGHEFSDFIPYGSSRNSLALIIQENLETKDGKDEGSSLRNLGNLRILESER